MSRESSLPDARHTTWHHRKRELPKSKELKNTQSPAYALQMCSLLHDSKLEVQRISYPLVRAAGQKQTDAIVLEAGLDTTGRNEFALPQELIDLLYTSTLLGDAEADVMEEAMNSVRSTQHNLVQGAKASAAMVWVSFGLECGTRHVRKYCALWNAWPLNQNSFMSGSPCEYGTDILTNFACWI